MTPDLTITTARLDLVIATPAFYSASLANDQATAESLLGASLPADWFAQRWIMDYFLKKWAHDPAYPPWALRAVILRSPRQMIGHIGFHTPPNPPYLQDLAPDGIEFGYTIYPAWQQQGFAIEAAEALMAWAHDRNPAVKRFVLSISPENVPSTRIAAHFGFRQIGSHVDEVDGLEIVYALEV